MARRRNTLVLLRQRFLDEYGPGERHLVGVSGGRDSMALLELLSENGYKELVVCHLNHKLRGRASEADARFVARAARRLRLKCEIGATDVKRLAGRAKISLELAGRRARHEFFARCARKHATKVIFLGHHADDLVETLLLNLFRGSGLAGLASLRETSTLTIGGFELTIARPLLHAWRRDVDAFVAEHQVAFREDISNADLASSRNRIRHRVLPYLERTMSRRIRQSLWRCAMIAAEEQALITAPMIEQDGTVAVTALRALPVALQRRVILRWLRANDVAEIGFEVVEQVRALTEPGASSARTNLPGARHVHRRAKQLFLE